MWAVATLSTDSRLRVLLTSPLSLLHNNTKEIDSTRLAKHNDGKVSALCHQSIEPLAELAFSHPEEDTTAVGDVYLETVWLHNHLFQQYAVTNQVYFAPMDDVCESFFSSQ